MVWWFFTKTSFLSGKICFTFVSVVSYKTFARLGQMLPLQMGYRHKVDLNNVHIPPHLVVSEGMFSVVALLL